MNPGSVVSIPDAVASRAGGRETVQPGLPGRWSVWSQAAVSPGAHFVVPIDDQARETGIKFATIRVTSPRGETARIQLLATQPAEAMPNTRTA